MDDREKLIELIERWNKDEFAISYASYELADYFIENGVVIQKQGEWKLKKDEYWGEYFICPFCYEDVDHHLTNYCPSCGAKMKEVK